MRKYTIRYTSYGPPRDRLRFVLDRISWIGIGHPQFQEEALLPCAEIVSTVLQQLDNTRGLSDRWSLQLGCKIDDKEGLREGVMPPTMDQSPRAADPTPYTQLPHTQLDFGTQVTHISRPRPRDHEPPALEAIRSQAGDKHRDDLRTIAAPSDKETIQKRLLSLLHKGKQATAVSEKSRLETSDHSMTRGRPSSISPKPDSARPKPTSRSPPLRKPGNEQASPSANTGATREAATTTTQEPGKDSIEHPSTETVECAWMKGFMFDSEALLPDTLQRSVLQKEESWFKTQPGVLPFPSNNMPITLWNKLSAIADEKIAVEGDSEQDSEMAVDSSAENVDDFAKAILDVAQAEAPTTSQVSWSVSPSPEPPQKSELFSRELPPDSSYEPTVPAAPQRPIIIESSNEKDQSLPPSSPPVINLPPDSDEEMEMETSVPQALGEDALQERQSLDFIESLQPIKSPKYKSIVQVEHTPYAKSKNVHYHKPDSSSNTTSTSSISIVRGTYDKSNVVSTAQRQNGQEASLVMPTDNVSREMSKIGAKIQQERPRQYASLDSREVAQAEKDSMASALSHTEVPSTQFGEDIPTGHDEQSPLKALAPSKTAHTDLVTTKRRLPPSPNKSSKRQSKQRRTIPVFPIESAASTSVDLALAYHEGRRQAYERFRVAHSSTRSPEPPLDSATKIDAGADAESMDVDPPARPQSELFSPARSPRHQSLYEDLQPVQQYRLLDESQHNTLVKDCPATRQSTEQEMPAGATEIDATEALTIFGTFKAAYPEYAGDVNHFEGQCTEMNKLEQNDRMVPKWQWDDFIIRHKSLYIPYAIDCLHKGKTAEPYHRYYKDNICDTPHRKGVIESTEILHAALVELGVLSSIPTPFREPEQPASKSRPSRTSLPLAPNRRTVNNSAAEAPHSRPRHSLPSSSHKPEQTPDPTPSHPRASLPWPSARLESSTSRSKLPQTSTASSRLSSILPPQRTNSQTSLSRAATPSDTPPRTSDPFIDFVRSIQRATSVTGSTTVSPKPNGTSGRKS